MKTLLAAILLVSICVAGMCFNIIFRKGGKFPETEISRNEEMRKRGITCMKEQDAQMHRRPSEKTAALKCGLPGDSACEGCSFYGNG